MSLGGKQNFDFLQHVCNVARFAQENGGLNFKNVLRLIDEQKFSIPHKFSKFRFAACVCQSFETAGVIFLEKD